MRFGLKEVIFLVVLIAVPTASVFYVFKPNQRNIDKQVADMEDKQAQLDQLARVKSDIEDIGRAIEEGQMLIDIIHRKLPTASNTDGMLDQIWPLTVGNGLTVKGITSKKKVCEGPYCESPLGVQLEGDFDSFYRFLLELENIDRITRIVDLKVERRKRNGPDEDGGMMKAEFTLATYFQPDTEVLATAEGADR